MSICGSRRREGVRWGGSGTRVVDDGGSDDVNELSGVYWWRVWGVHIYLPTYISLIPPHFPEMIYIQ